MDKLKMQTVNKADENFRKLAELFPNAVTETIDENGEIVRAIDKDVLMQEINTKVVDGREERYQFTWPDKKKSVLLANAPISKTLRPCREESVDFDNTENLYIEGDNLEVLKLLQETYLGKIKMIYIDPPYNTGNDFVYADDFAQSTDEYLENSGQFDEDGNRMVQNTESNGRFHTDWLNMIYPRLRLAKDLLSDDGVIFISIDENEIENVIKLGCEVFGESNYLGEIIVKSNPRGSMSAAEIASLHEYLVIFSKNRLECKIIGHLLTEDMTSEYKFNDENGDYRLLGLRMRGGFWRRSDRPKLYYPIYINPDTGLISLERSNEYCEEALPIQPSTMEDGTWRWSKEKVMAEGHLLLGKQVTRNGETCWDIYQKDYLSKGDEERRTKAKSIWDEPEINYQNGTVEIKNLFNKGGIFDYSKPVFLLMRVFEMLDLRNNDIILDFFSGSATTAHAVMKYNCETTKKCRFIMVQLPEETDEKSEAYKAGYKNICEIGKERIRRAGKKIMEDLEYNTVTSKGKYALRRSVIKNVPEESDKDIMDNPIIAEYEDVQRFRCTDDEYKEKIKNLDIGFRVLKCDSSNMKEVYYNPADYEPSLFSSLEDNIKEDRTPEDLLFQVMLDLGVLLSSKIEETTIAGKKVFNVEDNYLIACFDDNVTEEVITEIAKQKPYYFVMRDSSMANDSVATNFEQIFAAYSPETVRKVL